MKTYLDCVPCFFKQALEAARLVGAEEKMQQRILHEVAKALPQFSLSSSPPEMGRVIYGLVRRTVGVADPYLKIKKKSNRLALSLYSALQKQVRVSPDPLLTAVELAIAGNIIDYGVKNSLNVEQELERIIREEKRVIKQERRRFFAYRRFRSSITKARSILYLADNAGETVFDRLLIEEIQRRDCQKKIFYAVKERPVINDALREDALFCRLDKVATILSSGSDAPGTVLRLCSPQFLKVYRTVDMVISKGQGNFEALSQARRSVFFLFMAKCPVIAEDVGCKIGDVILLYRARPRRRQRP